MTWVSGKGMHLCINFDCDWKRVLVQYLYLYSIEVCLLKTVVFGETGLWPWIAAITSRWAIEIHYFDWGHVHFIKLFVHLIVRHKSSRCMVRVRENIEILGVEAQPETRTRTNCTLVVGRSVMNYSHGRRMPETVVTIKRPFDPRIPFQRLLWP